MANLSSPGSEVPQAHEGARYSNPSSKPLEGPVAKIDREDIQRVAWKLFFILILCGLAMAIVLGLVSRTS